MLFDYSHDFFDALIANILDLTEVYFNLPKVDGQRGDDDLSNAFVTGACYYNIFMHNLILHAIILPVNFIIYSITDFIRKIKQNI